MPRKGDFINVPDLCCLRCGGSVPVRYFIKRGKRAGQSRGPNRGIKYCSRHCAMLARNEGAEGHLDRHGYKVLPKRKRGAPQIYEHRRVMEEMLGRKLTKQETVHHRNGDRSDNRPENLELWESRHGRGQRVADHEPHWLPIYGEAMSMF